MTKTPPKPPSPPDPGKKSEPFLHWRLLPTNEDKAAYWSEQARGAFQSDRDAEGTDAYYLSKAYERQARMRRKKIAALRKAMLAAGATPEEAAKAMPEPDDREKQEMAFVEKVKRKYEKHLAREQKAKDAVEPRAHFGKRHGFEGG